MEKIQRIMKVEPKKRRFVDGRFESLQRKITEIEGARFPFSHTFGNF